LKREKTNIELTKLGPYTKQYKGYAKDQYTFPHGQAHNSPCMSFFWRQQAEKREQELKARNQSIQVEHDHEEKPEDIEELE